MSGHLEEKRAAAQAAAALVTPGSVVGLGTGSTSTLFVAALGRRVREGLAIVGVPTSEATYRQALDEQIPLSTLEEHPQLDLDVDGADLIDSRLRLVKGLGGALLREKIVASAADHMIVIADESKIVETIDGQDLLLPVEVIRFGWTQTRIRLEGLGATVTRRERADAPGQPVITDEGHVVLDCHFSPLIDPEEKAQTIKSFTGVVEHGFFLDIAATAIVGLASGEVRTYHRAGIRGHNRGHHT